MEPVARPRKSSFILFWVAFWGIPVAALEWLFDWYRSGRMGSIYDIASRFAVFAIGGVFLGLWNWRSSGLRAQKRISRKQTILFWTFMAFLAFLLWKMW
jgi:hypothetical protein